MARYHKIDGWRGYWIPQYAVAGARDTGTWPDSPCPTPEVKAELREFGKMLRLHGVRYRTKFGVSSNVFCGKRYIVVHSRDYPRALGLARDWFAANNQFTRYIHECEGDDSHRPGGTPDRVNADGTLNRSIAA